VSSFAKSATSATGLKQSFTGAMKAMTGGLTGMKVALMLGGGSAQTFAGNVKAIDKAAGHAGDTVIGFGMTQKDLNFQLHQVEIGADVLAVEFGRGLIPKVEDLIHWSMDMAHWLDQNRTVAYALAGVVATVLGVAIGDYTVNKAAKFISSTKEMAANLGKFASVVTRNADGVTKYQAKLDNLTGSTRAQGKAAATAGDETKTAGDQTEEAGTQSEVAGGKMSTAGAEARTAGAGMETAGTEAVTAGTEMSTAGGEATAAGGEFITAGTEADTAGAEMVTAGGEAEAAAGEMAGADAAAAGAAASVAGAAAAGAAAFAGGSYLGYWLNSKYGSNAEEGVNPNSPLGRERTGGYQRGIRGSGSGDGPAHGAAGGVISGAQLIMAGEGGEEEYLFTKSQLANGPSLPAIPGMGGGGGSAGPTIIRLENTINLDGRAIARSTRDILLQDAKKGRNNTAFSRFAGVSNS